MNIKKNKQTNKNVPIQVICKKKYEEKNNVQKSYAFYSCYH